MLTSFRKVKIMDCSFFTQDRTTLACVIINLVFNVIIKIRSSPPLLLNSKPFRHYYRRARELREGHSMKWNDGFLSNSLEASKTAAELPLKKVAEPPVKKDFLRKGFLNSRQSALSWGIGNGFSQTQASTVDFDHNREIVVWEKAFLERLPMEWMIDEGQGEEFRALLGKMIECQKSKGKRELRNLQSSVNYGDVKASSRCRKGKAHML
jgi:hypothetical protein